MIAEFARSWFVVGDHQVFPGYALLLLKRHVRELHELPPDEARELSDELLRATGAIVSAYAPWKMNHLSLGNQDQHVHWHLMPRYEADSDHHQQPFVHAARFAGEAIGADAALAVAAKIRAHL